MMWFDFYDVDLHGIFEVQIIGNQGLNTLKSPILYEKILL